MFRGSQRAVRFLQKFRALQQVALIRLAGQRAQALFNPQIRQIILDQFQIASVEMLIVLHAAPRLQKLSDIAPRLPQLFPVESTLPAHPCIARLQAGYNAGIDSADAA